jgi:2-polyprenyl-6-methoxyphenol hydroxylase-like FAD-dependent oxidoreductase
MKIPEETDVLIVGAGPTGLMLANQLARRGVDFVIIDRHAGPTVETRALGVQARTLEIYSHLGIADRAVELGKRTTGGNFWVKGRHAARIPLSDIGRGLSRYPFLLILGQDDNERLLGELLRKRGVELHWSHELTGLEQHSDHVTATIKESEGSIHNLRAHWVAGCDGARSAVRSLNEIAFLGAPYEHVFFVADTSATGPMVPSELNVYLWLSGFHLFFPMRGQDHWRLVGIVPPELRAREDLQFADVIPSITKHAGDALKFQECRWFSTYRIHHRRAERFRDRRCFLLGDAAHIHSPVGAQGMNTGLQDAYNLAWKLALVARKYAGENLLDSYEEERLPIARQLLRGTDRAFSIVVSDRLISRILRTAVIPRLAAIALRFDRVQKFVFRTISQTGIHYRASSLSEMAADWPDNAPQAGDRFPWLHIKFLRDALAEDLYAKLDDTRFNLIKIGQPSLPVLPELNDLLSIHEIPIDQSNDQELARAGIPIPSFYLLRPDGHVGLAGRNLESALLSRYLTERLKIRNPKIIPSAEQ